MTQTIYEGIINSKKKGKKKFAVLIDPDNIKLGNMNNAVEKAIENAVDYIFIGGSLMVNDNLDYCLQKIKQECNIPLVLFPGSSNQLSYKADALLFLSLISGRNPELLIGKHVEVAPFLKLSPLEIIPTGYMLIDGGVPTTVSYMSNTNPIPSDKSDIALCTALAGELLGLKLIYMDAGSGAVKPIKSSVIKAVSSSIEIPLIVGGGIRTPEKVYENVQAGADLIVVGNAIEKDPEIIGEMVHAIRSVNAPV